MVCQSIFHFNLHLTIDADLGCHQSVTEVIDRTARSKVKRILRVSLAVYEKNQSNFPRRHRSNACSGVPIFLH